MLEHGGRLLDAARRYGIAPEKWLDLSTGINPQGWPVPPTPAEYWRRLPEEEDGLEAAARRYLRCGTLLPVAGSQAAIQILPQLRRPGRAGVLSPGYAEHAAAWKSAGHELVLLRSERVDDAVDEVDNLVLINPNNPTGERFRRDTLLRWHARLARRGGWLVVDEAFADAGGESLAESLPRPGLIVLRSLGKFFGLAGVRCGFVLADREVLDTVRERLGPWSVSGPTRYVARCALLDTEWQTAARTRLAEASGRLAHMLGQHALAPAGGTPLFQWVKTPRAGAIHRLLAERAILVRLFREPASLRFGLPGSEEQWTRLEIALSELPGLR